MDGLGTNTNNLIGTDKIFFAKIFTPHPSYFYISFVASPSFLLFYGLSKKKSNILMNAICLHHITWMGWDEMDVEDIIALLNSHSLHYCRIVL
jgi:hypothetical protein